MFTNFFKKDIDDIYTNICDVLQVALNEEDKETKNMMIKKIKLELEKVKKSNKVSLDEAKSASNKLKQDINKMKTA